ncbi:class I SAM-dependent DNA methyltransferase [Vagococcus vulneris]|nr:class I SAM-dependent methyltransferase [Vagococcus vulneris]
MYKNYGPLAAQVYQITKPTGFSLNGDIDYYKSRLTHVSGPILEACCGTGRVLIPLLKSGYDIDGIDLSEEMLSICRKEIDHNSLKATLYCGDLANYHFDKKYAAIIMPSSSFNLFPSENIALSILKNLYHSLKDGGKFIFDIDLPYYPELNETTTSIYPLNDSEGITLEYKTLEIDWLKQQIVTLLKYEKWTNGQLDATELQNFTLRWYGLSELTLFLEKIGFKSIIISADYDYQSVPANSNQTITFECSK